MSAMPSNIKSAESVVSPTKRRKPNPLPSSTVEYLKAWMMSPDHIAHPHPVQSRRDGEILRAKKHYLKLYHAATTGVRSSNSTADNESLSSDFSVSPSADQGTRLGRTRYTK
mmetsp:Transcript_4332/g.5665  ORF Transcript_4332/g.5665 Transcript_4332/m.5665 type:complete len:112 (-) Transcript_4332:402-737(-)